MVYYILKGAPWVFQKHFRPNWGGPNFAKNHFFCFWRAKFGPKTVFFINIGYCNPVWPQIGWFLGVHASKMFLIVVLFLTWRRQYLVFSTLKLLLKSKYLSNRTTLKPPHLLPRYVNSRIHWWKNNFLLNLALQKQKKGFLAKFGSPQFGQKCFGIPKGHLSICSIPFSWEFTQIKISFQISVHSLFYSLF